MIVLEINRIMSVVRGVNRIGRMWELSMMRFMMHIMTLRHCNILPSGSHYLYSSFLIYVSMAASTRAKDFLVLLHHLIGFFSLIYCIYLFSPTRNFMACDQSTLHDESTNGNFYCSCFWSELLYLL